MKKGEVGNGPTPDWPARSVPHPYPVISKVHLDGNAGATISSGGGFLVSRSAAAAGAPQSPAKTSAAAKCLRIFCRPDPRDRSLHQCS